MPPKVSTRAPSPSQDWGIEYEPYHGKQRLQFYYVPRGGRFLVRQKFDRERKPPATLVAVREVPVYSDLTDEGRAFSTYAAKRRHPDGRPGSRPRRAAGPPQHAVNSLSNSSPSISNKPQGRGGASGKLWRCKPRCPLAFAAKVEPDHRTPRDHKSCIRTASVRAANIVSRLTPS